MLLGSNDSQLWRHERLEKVRRVASTILGMSESQLDLLIKGLHDYKGNLEVSWNVHAPTDHQKLAFRTAWEMSGESPDSVSHDVQPYHLPEPF